MSSHESISEDEIQTKITRLIDLGLIEVHPDDRGKPWDDRRLRRTQLGDEMHADITRNERTRAVEAEVIKEGWFYLPTLLISDDGTKSLFVRHYIARRGPKSGKVRTEIQTDVWQLASDQAVADAIEEHAMSELPEEADGDPQFLPAGFRPGDLE